MCRTNRWMLRGLAVVIVAALVAACGGGGDDAALKRRGDGKPDGSPGTKPDKTTTTVGDTTTTPSENGAPSTVKPGTGGPIIGYVGCSNSADAIAGYHLIGGSRFWREMQEYGGATLQAWKNAIGEPDGYWAAFQAMLEEQPTKTFWVSMCAHPNTTDQENHDDAVAVIQEIRRLVPGAAVFVSSINGYVAPHVCDLIGADGAPRLNATADQLVAEGWALRGPDVGDLISMFQTPSDGATQDNNETETDGCHPNARGEAHMGERLRQFEFFADVTTTSPG